MHRNVEDLVENDILIRKNLVENDKTQIMISILEAIEQRHSVRKYFEKPLEPKVKGAIYNRIQEINAKTGLHIQLVCDEPKSFQGIMAYGKFSGVSNYIIMAGPKGDRLNHDVGYYGEQLVLLAQQLGLNTCWAGVSYTKIAGTYELAENEKIACYIALGYGLTPGVQHKSRSLSDISNIPAAQLTSVQIEQESESKANDTRIDNIPQWFIDGVKAAQLAPTAVNQQRFFIEYKGQVDSKGQVAIYPGKSLIGYTQMDMGIARLHFEIGAGVENFEWVE